VSVWVTWSWFVLRGERRGHRGACTTASPDRRRAGRSCGGSAVRRLRSQRSTGTAMLTVRRKSSTTWARGQPWLASTVWADREQRSPGAIAPSRTTSALHGGLCGRAGPPLARRLRSSGSHVVLPLTHHQVQDGQSLQQPICLDGQRLDVVRNHQRPPRLAASCPSARPWSSMTANSKRALWRKSLRYQRTP
jgi:hypothetical protein